MVDSSIAVPVPSSVALTRVMLLFVIAGVSRVRTGSNVSTVTCLTILGTSLPSESLAWTKMLLVPS